MIIVCVTEQSCCDRLILAGYRLSKKWNEPLQVITVRPKRMGRCDADHDCWLASPELEYLADVCHSVDADLYFMFDDHPDQAVIRYIETHQPATVVTGVPPAGTVSAFNEALRTRFPELAICPVDADGRLTGTETRTALRPAQQRMAPWSQLYG